jgi:phage N-6-adenine-methyltransferase
MSEFRNGVPESSGSDLWQTPPHILEALEERYGPLFDPCPANWDGKTDGLEIEWPVNQVVFVNPPFSQLSAWAEKVWSENFHRGVQVVMLMPARVDTQYFHDYICNGAELEFFKGRIRFIDPGTTLPGDAAPFASMLCHFTDTSNYTRYQKSPIPAREGFA